jgi:hypothetical protein
MIAALIAGASVVGLFPLFVSYCGTVLASARRVELSDRVSSLAEARDRSVSGEDFDRILQLVRLCPEHDAERSSIQAVAVYYRLLDGMNRTFGGVSPSLASWTERERGDCSHFAAVVLDRSISSSRNLLAEQGSDHS